MRAMIGWEVIGVTRAEYRPPEGYLTMAQAEKRLSVSKATLQKIVRAGQLASFRDPRNKRVRLVKVDDVDRLTQPVPASR